MGIKQKINAIGKYFFGERENVVVLAEDDLDHQIQLAERREKARAKTSVEERTFTLGVGVPVTEKLNTDGKEHNAVVRFLVDARSREGLDLLVSGLTQKMWAEAAEIGYGPCTPAPFVKVKTFLVFPSDKGAELNTLRVALNKARKHWEEKAALIGRISAINEVARRGQAAIDADNLRGVNGEDPNAYNTRHVFVRAVVKVVVKPIDKKGVKGLALVVQELRHAKAAHPRLNEITEDWLNEAIHGSAEVMATMTGVANSAAAAVVEDDTVPVDTRPLTRPDGTFDLMRDDNTRRL